MTPLLSRNQRPMPMRISSVPRTYPMRASALAVSVLVASQAHGQQTNEVPVQPIAPIVVTGTRIAQDPQWLPMAIDSVDAETLRAQTLQINLSESLQRIPGLNIQNRSNFAQDLQISSRGFGGRASFGVRGIRLYADGIPASQPDGQGQVSHFAIGSADRIEVLRGPFSVLYGNASGGVMQIFTEDAGKTSEVSFGAAASAHQTWRASVRASGRVENVGIVGEAAEFSTQGFRPQSGATKTQGNVKLAGQFGSTKLTLIGNSVDIRADDALGLTRAEFDANPDQTTAVAMQFNTRKDTRQSQFGFKVEQPLADQLALEAVVYSGSRNVTQWQSIPVATQTPATQPGGVIAFDRSYGGIDARLIHKAGWGSLVLGANVDDLDEDRKGYENFFSNTLGTTLGVTGRLRRDEQNKVTNRDVYLQSEFKASDDLRFTVGVRRSRVAFVSDDRYIIVGRNPDDSGRVSYSRTTPAFGVNFQLSKGLNIYASAGRGFETPTFNELAYRASGQTGLNFDLKPAISESIEAGIKFRDSFWRANAAVFDTRTKSEIVTLTNSGGRATFQNAGRTSRRGAELSLSANLPNGFDAAVAATYVDATYRDSFNTCIAAPCTTPIVVVAAGKLLPGVPAQSLYAELRWSHPSGFTAALESKYQGKIFVNDLNTDSAAANVVANARVGYARDFGTVKLSAGIRIDNLTDKRYAGTVIVNEGNSRFFEPAPGRTWLATVSLSTRF
jgi:iron complex outermembrane recepter protein